MEGAMVAGVEEVAAGVVVEASPALTRRQWVATVVGDCTTDYEGFTCIAGWQLVGHTLTGAFRMNGRWVAVSLISPLDMDIMGLDFLCCCTFEACCISRYALRWRWKVEGASRSGRMLHLKRGMRIRHQNCLHRLA